MRYFFGWGSLLLIVSMQAGCSSIPLCRTVNPIIQAGDPVITALAAELQREHLAGTFDGLILVAQGEQVVFKTAYGCADRGGAVANQSAVISDMGSIAKTFTAAAVLQLAQSGQLSLSDTLAHYYPTAPEALKPITIQQLLGHSSGLDNFHNDSDFEVMDKVQAEARILALPLLAGPGEKVAYSNAGYTLLAAIVETVSGQPFQTYIQQQLLTPLQLDNTGFYQDRRLAQANLARGYGGDAQGSTTYEKGLTWALVGAGGMVSSIDDLQRWSMAIKQGSLFVAGAPNLVFSPANERWLLGSLAQTSSGDEVIIQMGGSTDYGYTALIQFVPERDLLLVLLLNAHNNKYANATHHRLSREHILPILLSQAAPFTDI